VAERVITRLRLYLQALIEGVLAWRDHRWTDPFHINSVVMSFLSDFPCPIWHPSP